MLIQYSYFNIRYSNINRMKLSSFPIKERGTKCPFVRLLDMKKKERMKIYTLLFGILFVSPTQAQTMHDWENHHVLQINREPARAAFTPFSVQKGDGSISLDGTWKFRWTPVPNERVMNFYQTNFNDKDWTDFPVPANWEVNGYGTPIYVSAGYPFKIDPPRVMGEPKTDYTTYKERNPVGQYRRTFVLPAGWETNGQTFLRFEGVMSAFYVWINGERVGYSQGSMEPSEFNVTKYLKSGENQISLEVYRYSDGSYLEDQDFWRFGGIHRSIHLIHTPDIHVRDYAVRTLPASAGDYEDFILQIDPQAIVIFMTAYADTDKAVRAIKAGATDFIPKPWEKEKLLATLTSGMRLRQSQREVNILKEQVEALSGQSSPEGDIIGESPVMQEVFATINKLSSTDANILILGENGTGKDVIARLLYRCSPRYGKPFVTIDLGSIPEQLFESELFGFEKGAFTDAKKSKAGRMEVATNGTLFLDEIGNLSLPMQSKLLTAIEKRQISRLGSTQAVPIDVRLICATNADIHRMVDEGSFRQDLLYRINTIEIHIPPLRERGNDIILLAEYFLDRYARKYKKEMRGLTREAKNKLLKYTWPGNVRELQHTMERVVILGDGSLLKPENFQFHVTPKQKKEEEIVLNLEQLERQTIEKAMKLSEGNISRAADYLGITRFALYRKLEKLGL